MTMNSTQLGMSVALLLTLITESPPSPTYGGTEIQMEVKFQHTDQQIINKLMSFISSYQYEYAAKPYREREFTSEDEA